MNASYRSPAPRVWHQWCSLQCCEATVVNIIYYCAGILELDSVCTLSSFLPTLMNRNRRGEEVRLEQNILALIVHINISNCLYRIIIFIMMMMSQ